MRRVIDYVLRRTANSLARRIAAILARSDDLASRVAYRVAVEGRLQPIDGRPPRERFHGISDDFWFWICTEGFRRHTQLQDLLPGVPDESVQVDVTGSAGDPLLLEGFRFYQLVSRLYRTHVGPLEDCGRVLDFGCGWGRIIRFFLRDLDPSRLYGVDPDADMIRFCQGSNRWCTFERTKTRPPTAFPPESIDLIYAFSVFSHLSEPVHEEWLIEFKRVLRPGGLLIATTRARDFIPRCEEIRNNARLRSLSSGFRASARSFPNTAESLAAYDRGEYCFTLLDDDYWGECAIPKGYVTNRWTRHLTFVDYIDDRARCSQNVIVMQK
jgi:SAM-dependent methyltransferase